MASKLKLKLSPRQQNIVNRLARVATDDFAAKCADLRGGKPSAVEWHLLRFALGIEGDLTFEQARQYIQKTIYT